ncbi:Zn-ribbon domain-containing OB-fold protein [Alkalibacillus salilacus]|uniref:OB-fold protein n=1 Tax=Alkalibacillus salilacus TaxID=284582 RepID=A0ABT9VB03_9BACI|nr:OB-fold domain-containing protein [Alkalibacillus salilacus]MDQ0158123.1 putative OB-fold protein [Alkalibacillus salilacus]
MIAYQCINCGFQSVTKKYYCPECKGSKYEEVNVSDEGEVFSYTTIHIPPEEFTKYAPYQVVLVQLEDKLRVTGFMEVPVAIGDKVTFKEIREGAYVFSK